MSSIKLYDGFSLTGARLDLYQGCPDLGEFNFNDRTKSLKTEDSSLWVLYGDADYRDFRHTYSGPYPDVSCGVSSLRPLPTDGVLLFWYDRGCGPALYVQDSLNYIGDRFNDEICSIYVASGTWNVYTDSDFSGDSATISANYQKPLPFTNGFYTSMADVGIPKNALSSIKRIG